MQAGRRGRGRWSSIFVAWPSVLHRCHVERKEQEVGASREENEKEG
jgi:hypothetical protein